MDAGIGSRAPFPGVGAAEVGRVARPAPEPAFPWRSGRAVFRSGAAVVLAFAALGLLAPLVLAQPTYKSSPFFGLQLERDFRQTSSAGPVPQPNYPAIFYAFLLPNTAGFMRLPSGIASAIPANNQVFNSFPTFAALDAAYPPGTYVLVPANGNEIPLTLPPNPFPTDIPRVLDGTWNAAGQLELNASLDTTITINAFTGFGRTGVDTNLSIDVFDDAGTAVLGRQYYSSETPGLFTSFTIPGGTLTTGKAYACSISFGVLHAANTSAISGATAGIFVNNYLEFSLAVLPPSPGAPVIVAQPASQTITAGSTVVFSVAAVGDPVPTYRWRRGSSPIPGENGSTLVLSGAAASAGSYNCQVINTGGMVTSADAVLTVVTVPAAEVGRLVNLSVLAPTGPGAQLLTMGATVGGQGTSGALPLLIRGVGPTLGGAPFHVANVLPDPVLAIFPAGSAIARTMNDDWGGTPELVAAFASVGAFGLAATSLDSAAWEAQPAGGFTVQVAGKGGASGRVIAEVYDAAGSTRRVGTPRLINLSTLTAIGPAETLTAGFVVGGSTARSVLVRAVGPTLESAFGISGAMNDPKLELFDNRAGAKIAENDNWSGAAWLLNVQRAVGAFPLGGAATKDAALVISLPPGPYSARVSGLNGGGTTIIEVYEVP